MSIYKAPSTTSIATPLANTESLIHEIISKLKWAYKHNTKMLVPQRFGLGNTVFENNFTVNNVEYENITIQTLPISSGAHRDVNTMTYSSYTSINPFNSKVGFIIDGTIIILADTDKLNQLKSYIFSVQDDSFKYPLNKSISGVTYNLSIIENGVKNVKNALISANKFVKLNDKEYLILDLPIIMWKIGWYHSAVCILNWLTSGNTLIFSAFFCGQTYPRSKTKVSEAINAFKNYTTSTQLFDLSLDTPKSNHDSLLSLCNTMSIGSTVSFGDSTFSDLPIHKDDATPVNFIGSTAIGSMFGDLDDLGGSLGLYKYAKYIAGTINKINNNLAKLTITHVCFRFSDIFSFNDNDNFSTTIQGGSQLLGSWKDNVYATELPNKIVEYDGSIQISNKNFRTLRENTKVGLNIIVGFDFLIYAPPDPKTIGTGSNQLNIPNNPILINL